MNQTRVESAAGPETTQSVTEAVWSALNPVLSLTRGVWLIGLGSLVLAGEQAGKLLRMAADKGRQAEPLVTGQLRRAEENVMQAVSGMGDRFKGAARLRSEGEPAASALEGREIPTKEDVDRLVQRLDELNRKIDQLGSAQREL
ncbi:MAG: phasin family protein [Bryobacteraceae bacterium]|nr:phasin family protein [Bryobacteraceae bacterium]